MNILVTILSSIFLAFLFGCSGGSNNDSTPINTDIPIQITLTERSFNMGTVPIPQDWTEARIIDAHQMSSNIGEVVSLSQKLGWTSEEDIDQYENDVTYARERGLDVIISVDVLEDDRSAIANLPDELLGQDFSDPTLRQYYTNEVLSIVTRYQPKQLLLAIEINGYFMAYPEDFPNFVSLYYEVYDAIKNISSGTEVAVSFHYGSLNGNAQWDLLDLFEGRLDFIGLTTYPGLLYGSLNAVPQNYYSPLTSLGNTPIIFTEIGWQGSANNAGEREQAEFVNRFFELTGDTNLTLAIWALLHDWQGGGVFETMGLVDQNGRKKRAWDIWKEIYDLPKN